MKNNNFIKKFIQKHEKSTLLSLTAYLKINPYPHLRRQLTFYGKNMVYLRYKRGSFKPQDVYCIMLIFCYRGQYESSSVHII